MLDIGVETVRTHPAGGKINCVPAEHEEGNPLGRSWKVTKLS